MGVLIFVGDRCNYAMKQHDADGLMIITSETPLWKRLYYFAFIPMTILVTYNARYIMDHSHPRPPFYKYDHLRIRNQQFPWPDSNRSLIHSKKHNPLPDGYEEYDETAH